jgi:hypothetical protein
MNRDMLLNTYFFLLNKMEIIGGELFLSINFKDNLSAKLKLKDKKKKN